MGLFTPADYESALHALQIAPFEPERWPEALDLVARAGGGWAAQMLGLDTDGVFLHFASGLSSEALDEFEREDGATPGINPRIAPFLGQAVFGIVSDDDYIDAQARSRSCFYQGLFKKFDADFATCASLVCSGDRKIGVTIVRSQRQGHAQLSDYERLRPLLQPMAAALHLQRTLSNQGALLAAASLDALSITAFLCDGMGRVVALTEGAERLLESGDLLQVRGRRLCAASPDGDRVLQDSLRSVCGARGPENGSIARPLILHDRAGQPRRVDVAPIPHRPILSRTTAAAVVAVRDSLAAPTRALLQQAFGLTPAEASVALEVAKGRTAGEIASQRRVGRATVRGQIAEAMEKMGVGKAAALATAIARLGGQG